LLTTILAGAYNDDRTTMWDDNDAMGTW